MRQKALVKQRWTRHTIKAGTKEADSRAQSVVGTHELEGPPYDFFGPSSFFPMSVPRSFTPRTRSSFARICGFGIARPAS